MYILFDIGGTKTRVALSEDLQELAEVRKFDTPLMYHEGIEAICSGIEHLRGDRTITAIAGGIRGPLNHEKTSIISETKLIDWVGRNIALDIKRQFDVPISLQNDSALACLGEAWFGAGKGFDIVAYHTVSTGVGGARTVHGHLDETSVGFEPGHQILDLDRTVLGVHTQPTLENLVSGASLEKRRGVKPYEIPQDDHVWDQLAEYLAFGLKNTIVYWSPDVIVLGGAMILGNPRIMLQSVIDATTRILEDQLPCPPIKEAILKDDGGLFGAMALMRSRLNAAPSHKG